MSTKEEYQELFNSKLGAGTFENALLQSGDEGLPECALSVAAGGEPTKEYWDFIISEKEAWDQDMINSQTEAIW